jgi:Protein of unknown function (DUF1203)
MSYRCVAMKSETYDRWRRSGSDDGGNRLQTLIAEARGYPCRHCLREAGEGRRVLLGSFHVERPAGAFWTASPIFVHADACDRYQQGAAGELPEVFLRNDTLLSVRPYDAGGMLLYDLNDVSPARAADALLRRCVADARTHDLNVHTARPGCFLFRVERA